MDGLDYKPRNSKEKWLMRIAWELSLGSRFLVGVRESEVARSAGVIGHLFYVVRWRYSR
jgi:hypothetical protein